MSNYFQWIKTFKDSTIPRVIYIYGDVPTLVESALDEIKFKVGAPQTEQFTFMPNDEYTMWTTAFSQSLDYHIPRILVIRNAEDFDSWYMLHPWLINRNPNCYLVFISGEKDLPEVFIKGKKSGHASHIETIKSRGKIVKCSQPSDVELIEWLETQHKFGATLAKNLVDRVCGDVYEIFNVVKKIEAIGASASKSLIELLTTETALDSFMTYLLFRDYPNAMLAIPHLDAEEIKALPKRIEQKLNFFHDLGRCVRSQMYTPDIVSELNVSHYQVRLYKDIVKKYDDKKIQHCRKVVALLEEDLFKPGGLECLVAMW